jgi:DNA (cytosine-5)-methyltransferase 1
MKLLDLFCGAGGAAMGYYRAGFTEIVGIDIKPQPRYPFTFIRGDALMLPVDPSRFDAIHASPPCQFGSEATPMEWRAKHPNLIPATREMLQRSGKPYVIENVENVRAHLNQALMLCGTMVGLPIWRHRYFEVHPFIAALTPPCVHDTSPITIHSGSYSRKLRRPILCTGGGDGKRANRRTHRPREAVANIRIAMGIPWMTQAELSQAIPPAYTEWIGKQLLQAIR